MHFYADWTGNITCVSMQENATAIFFCALAVKAPPWKSKKAFKKLSNNVREQFHLAFQTLRTLLNLSICGFHSFLPIALHQF